MNINMILEPEKVLDFDGIQIVLKGLTPDAEMYIEALKYKQYTNEDELWVARRSYIKRMLCCCIKEVRGLSINDVPFKLQLITTNGIELVHDDSYNVLMQVFNKKIKKDLITPVEKFYSASLNGDELDNLYEVEPEDDKKKD